MFSRHPRKKVAKAGDMCKRKFFTTPASESHLVRHPDVRIHHTIQNDMPGTLHNTQHHCLAFEQGYAYLGEHYK